MIELEQVVRHYGSKVAVAGLDLVIGQGELFAFLGPNGAGKTTTIKMLVGLLQPTSGRIRVCGHDVVKDVRSATQCLAYVPDEPYLYDKLTGREFLEFVLDVRGVPSAEAQRRIAKELDYFELHSFVDELSESYSHGMKQRLVFAAAMVTEPRVLVLDEPMVGLDPRSARLVKDLLRNKAAEGVTILMSTHTLTIAEEIANRVGIIDHGRLRFIDDADVIRRQLADQRSSLEQLFLEITSGEGETQRAGTN
jgi:ABC-2 type transport system ATP-binding protein